MTKRVSKSLDAHRKKDDLDIFIEQWSKNMHINERYSTKKRLQTRRNGKKH